MGMFDEIKAEAVVKGPPCSISLIVEQMSKQEKADFDKAIADPSIPGTIIARVLSRHGYAIKPTSVNRHRKGECRCERV